MLIGNLRYYRVILASQSLRRQQLMRELGIDFEVVIKDFDESFPEDLKGKEIALYVADKKAAAFSGEISHKDIVITADTIVWCNNKVLGKPVDVPDALNMLKEISENTHEVITAVCLLTYGKRVMFSETTKVTFGKISDKEILYYIDKYAPYDKAGAYGIQEWIGLTACSHIDGSYFNVVGLPVQRLYNELKKIVRDDRLLAAG